MEIVDFSRYKKFNRQIKYFYQDDLDVKIYEDVEYDNCIWKLKYGPQYKYECFSEYIGSHIFDILGMPVHDTLLGICEYDNMIMPVVACKDFTTDRFLRFDEMVNLSVRGLQERKKPLLENELEKIIFWFENQNVIDSQKLLKSFYKMILIDTFIGNADRNWENFGVLVNDDKQARFAPVFDNGDCLYSVELNRDVNFMKKILTNIYANNNAVCKNFYGFENILYRLISLKDNLLKDALCWATDTIQEKKILIEKMIDDILLLEDNEKEFYKILLEVNHNFLDSVRISLDE